MNGSGSLEEAIRKSQRLESDSKVWPNGLPICLHVHLFGIIVTVSGMPVDLGFPGNLDLKTIEKKGHLEI